MKRIICLITVLCLILGSFSFCFAQDWSASDSQNLASVAQFLYSNSHSAAYYLYNIATNTNNLYNKAVDIYNALNYSGHTIAYWVNAINTWMQPIYTAITAVPSDLSVIQGLLGYPTNNSGVTTWHPYLSELLNGSINNSADYFNLNFDSDGKIQFGSTYHGTNLFNAINSNLYWIQWLNMNKYNLDLWTANALTSYYSASQNAVNWGNLSTSSFTPVSSTDGIYKWLSAIQAPVARLSYVLANDQEIEARDAAAANQEAVVDNFIDSSGNGSASTSDFGSISDLSAGYKSNFGSDASVSGLFNIFNSNNMGWFSQETANQLDTTTPTRRGSSFDTPLLDQQINDIYDQIGVKHD